MNVRGREAFLGVNPNYLAPFIFDLDTFISNLSLDKDYEWVEDQLTPSEVKKVQVDQGVSSPDSNNQEGEQNKVEAVHTCIA